MRSRFRINAGWKLAAGLLLAAAGFLGGCQGQSAAPTKQFMFWPPPPEPPHLQFLTSISRTGDVTGKQNRMDEIIYGKDAGGDLPFARPYGVRMKGGKIYVCDATSANVSILDMRNKEVRILGRTGQVTLMKPIDIAVAPDGLKYVADTGLGAVIVFDETDHYAGRITAPDLRPVSVGVFENELYVADMKGSRVRVFDRLSGAELRSIGGPGGEKGQMGGAMGLALDKQGNLYVNDVVGCRVQKFSRDGKVLEVIGGQGDNPGNFVRPKHMAVDSSGILYVVDNAFQNVQMFNDKGQLLMFFGAPGRHPGAMDMPTGVCVNDEDLDLFAPYVHPAFELQRLVVVTNNYGPTKKINIYGLGELKPGKTVADVSSSRIKAVVGFAEKSRAVDSEALGQPATQPATQPGGPGGAATEPAVSTQPAKP